MFLFKLLFSLTALLASTPIMDEEGWVSLPRPTNVAEAMGADERDPSIWVVFAKQLGTERLMVRFPDEPTYHYFGEQGEMEVISKAGGNEHRLQVLSEVFPSSDLMCQRRLEQLGHPPVVYKSMGKQRVDLILWQEGAWLQERWIRADHHTFFLQTKSDVIERDAHKIFVKSFDFYTPMS
jgi:hypothetical protein